MDEDIGEAHGHPCRLGFNWDVVGPSKLAGWTMGYDVRQEDGMGARARCGWAAMWEWPTSKLQDIGSAQGLGAKQTQEGRGPERPSSGLGVT